MIATGFGESERDAAEERLNSYDIALDGRPEETPPDVMREGGFVYFATCDVPDFPIKIGWTKNWQRRRVQLQVTLPHKVILLGMKPGTLDDERKLHIAFHASRLEGEWFRRTPELVAMAAPGAASNA